MEGVTHSVIRGGGFDHCVRAMSHTPFIQRLLSCCTAVPGLLVYFVNVDVGQLTHAAAMDMSVSVVNTSDHLSPLWADS